MVADDDGDDQFFFGQALRELKLPHELQAVYNGLQLMDLLKSNKSGGERPDLVILDLNMPLLDGYGVLEQMGQDPELRQIPVFILSTSRFDHHAVRSRELGARQFYSKPYRFEELKEIVQEIYHRAANV